MRMRFDQFRKEEAAKSLRSAQHRQHAQVADEIVIEWASGTEAHRLGRIHTILYGRKIENAAGNSPDAIELGAVRM